MDFFVPSYTCLLWLLEDLKSHTWLILKSVALHKDVLHFCHLLCIRGVAMLAPGSPAWLDLASACHLPPCYSSLTLWAILPAQIFLSQCVPAFLEIDNVSILLWESGSSAWSSFGKRWRFEMVYYFSPKKLNLLGRIPGHLRKSKDWALGEEAGTRRAPWATWEGYFVVFLFPHTWFKRPLDGFWFLPMRSFSYK